MRDWLGYAPAWGAFGLTASAGFAAWIEFLLLKRWLGARIGRVPIPGKLGLGPLAASALAGPLGYVIGRATLPVVAIPVFGVVYIAVMGAAKVPEAGAFVARLRRRPR